jgi:hypothetical protein
VWIYIRRGVSCVLNISVGFPSLYATLMYVACSQLEKLRAALQDIKQAHVIPEQNWGMWFINRSERGKLRQYWSSQVKCRNNWTPAFVMTGNKTVCWRSADKIVILDENVFNNIFLFCVWNYRYTTAQEETIKFVLCGLFLLLLAAFCFIALCAVMVKLSLWLRYIGLPQYLKFVASVKDLITVPLLKKNLSLYYFMHCTLYAHFSKLSLKPN